MAKKAKTVLARRNIVEDASRAMIPEMTNIERKAHALQIRNDADAVAAGEFIKGVKVAMQRVHDLLDDPIRKAHEAHRAITERRTALLNPLRRAENVVKDSLSAYASKRQAELEAQAEKERLKLERKMQRRRETEIKALQRRGRHDEAEDLQDAAIPVPIVEPPNIRMASGVSTRRTFTFTIIDRSKIPDEYWILDTDAIGKVVRSLGPRANIPGIRVVVDTGIAASKG